MPRKLQFTLYVRPAGQETLNYSQIDNWQPVETKTVRSAKAMFEYGEEYMKQHRLDYRNVCFARGEMLCGSE
jgi:hypothetical protein